MRKLVPAIILSAVPFSAFADDTAANVTKTVEACFASGSADGVSCVGNAADACQNASITGSQTQGIIGCLDQEAKAWDKLLNAQYADLQKKQSGNDEFLGKLKGAQNAWINFRDVDCSLAAAKYSGGSMAGVAAVACKMKHTADRTFELAEFGQEG